MTRREAGNNELQGLGGPRCFTRGWRPESLFVVCWVCYEGRSSVAAMGGGGGGAPRNVLRVRLPKNKDASSARARMRGQNSLVINFFRTTSAKFDSAFTLLCFFCLFWFSSDVLFELHSEFFLYKVHTKLNFHIISAMWKVLETRLLRMFPFRGSKTGNVWIKAMRLHLLRRMIKLIENNVKCRYPK
jgi:hypothetical protein